MSWYVLFRTHAKLRLFTFRCVAHKRVTEHVTGTMFERNILQTRQHFLEAHTDARFCYKIRRTKHELPYKIMCKIDKIMQNYKGITFHLA